MKRKGSRVLLYLALILTAILFPLLSGCSCNIVGLASPDVMNASAEKTILWRMVDRAKQYEIFCNDKSVAVIASEDERVVYEYDYSDVTKGGGQFTLFVRAETSFSHADSNVITVVISSIDPTESDPDADKGELVSSTVSIADSIQFVPLTISGSTLTFSPKINEKYVLYLYCSSIGLRYVPIDEQALNGKIQLNLLSSKYALTDEIYAIRIGRVDGENDIKVVSEIAYFNPISLGDFSKNVFLFDGLLNDYYIKTLNELRTVVYHSFITRDDDFNVMLSSDMFSILNLYAGDNLADKMSNAVVDCFNYFNETRDAYSIGCKLIKSGDSRYFEISINYRDNAFLNQSHLPECNTDLVPDQDSENILKDTEFDAYYQYCGKTMRKDDPKYALQPYDEFVSDKQFLSTVVGSSEELYWAVENGVTPIVKPDSRAEDIYGKAKDVLNSIISDSMTDSEKALSIFDWICTNTLYDYEAVEEDSYDGSAVTLQPAFYLEGVFTTGYAVCDGFSKAYSLLCNMEGIECVRITGSVRSGGVVGLHAWNKVFIDDDKTDDIAGQYYVVDITWTSIDTSDGEELSTHNYFLISDKEIEPTHTAFDKREKFSNYPAPDNFGYYSLPIFEKDDVSYSAVITEKEQLNVVFMHMLNSGRKTFELVFELGFMQENLVAVNETANIFQLQNLNELWNALVPTLKAEKFPQQYMILNITDMNGTLYPIDHDGTQGLLVVFQQNLLIDEQSDISQIATWASENSISAEYHLYVKYDMLNMPNGAPATDPQGEIAEQKFSELLGEQWENVNFEYDYIDMEEEQGDDFAKAHFVVKFVA